jgi:hypothetical protein
MANTFELIASSTVGSGGAANIEFTSIPSTFTDLCVKISSRSDRNVFNFTLVKVQFNSSTSGYTYINLTGDGSGVSSTNTGNSGEGSTGIIVPAQSQINNTLSTFGSVEIYIPNYAGSSYKSLSGDGASERDATAAGIGFAAGLWSNTAAITSITLIPQIGGTTFNFLQYSTAYLYGVKNA